MIGEIPTQKDENMNTNKSLDDFVTGLIDRKLSHRMDGVVAWTNFRFLILFVALVALGAFTFGLSDRLDRLEKQPRPVPSPLLPVEPQTNSF